MGMDITFKHKHEGKYITIVELRGYDIFDIITSMEGFPEVEYKRIDKDPIEGYDTYWLSSKTIENYKTIVSILKDMSDPLCVAEDLEIAIDKLEPIFENDQNAEVYMELSF